MKILGLTGSIGMGKSATAELFRAEGVPVHDSDAAVHELYRGVAAPLIDVAFPGTVVQGVVDRALLRDRVLADPAEMRRLEAIVHPLVARHRDAFLADHRCRDTPVVVLDIPLLYEVGAERHVDAVVVVSAPESVQRRRVLERPGMTPARLDAILAQQMPDADKRARATFVIETDRGLEDAAVQVRGVLRALATAAAPASEDKPPHA